MAAELNWRRAYYEAVERERDQLRAWRSDPDCPPLQRRQYLPGLQRSRSVFDLTDEQIESSARYPAEVAVNEAIHLHGHAWLVCWRTSSSKFGRRSVAGTCRACSGN